MLSINDTELKELQKELKILKENEEENKKKQNLKKEIYEIKHKNDFINKLYDFVVGGLINIGKGIYSWLDKMSDPPEKRR